MNRRQRDKRRRFFGLFSDPWRKLISIVLGLLLWYYLNAQITKEHETKLPILFNRSISANHFEARMPSTEFGMKRFINNDTDEEVKEITLYLQGPNRLIEDAKKHGQLAFEVVLGDAQDATPPFVLFNIEDIHHKFNADFERLLQQMHPRTVRVELQKIANKPLTLKKQNVFLTIDGTDAEKLRSRLKGASFEPTMVTVFGPDEQLNSIGADTELFAASIQTRQIRRETEIPLQLELAESFAERGISVSKLPTVTYELDPIRVLYKLMDVPIVLDWTRVGEEAGLKYEVDPPIHTITIGVSGELNDALSEYFKAGTSPNLVLKDWTVEHAQFRVVLRKTDIDSDAMIPRTPTLRLFTLDTLDRERVFAREDYELREEDLPKVIIKKRKLQ